MKKIRTILVDDESIAIRGLQMALRSEVDIEVVATCQDGEAAVTTILQLQPDLVFLDINMPGMSGFDVIEAVGLDSMPAVIFVTAYDQYAIRAFDVHALDYVLKPVDPQRLQQALARVRKSHAQQGGATATELAAPDLVREQIRAVLTELGVQPTREWCRRLAIRQNGRTLLVDIDEVQWIEAAGNYVEIHRLATPDSKLLTMRETLASVESRLDPARLVRISRSTIVNIAQVAEIQPMFNGDFVVVLKDKTVLDGSRRFRPALDQLLA